MDAFHLFTMRKRVQEANERWNSAEHCCLNGVERETKVQFAQLIQLYTSKRLDPTKIYVFAVRIGLFNPISLTFHPQFRMDRTTTLMVLSLYKKVL